MFRKICRVGLYTELFYAIIPTYTTRHVVGHETPEYELYIDIKAFNPPFLRF